MRRFTISVRAYKKCNSALIGSFLGKSFVRYVAGCQFYEHTSTRAMNRVEGGYNDETVYG